MPDLWQAHLTFALIGFLLLSCRWLPRRFQWPLLFALGLVSFIPIADLPVAAYPRSITSDLAITTMVALVWATVARLRLIKGIAASHRWQIIFCFGAFALLLYPAALGLTYFDPYRFGYSPRPLIVVMGVLSLMMLYWRNTLGMSMLALATLAFIFEMKASENYWDYLLDPFLTFYCWGAIVLRAGKSRLWRAAPTS